MIKSIRRWFYQSTSTPKSRKKQLLGRSFIWMRVWDDCKGFCYKKLYFQKICIYSISYTKKAYQICLGPWVVYYRTCQEMFDKQFSKFILPQTDHIYIINSNLGELYCFLAYFAHFLIKQDTSSRPLFWITQQRHAEVIRLFLPQIKTVFVDNLQRYSRQQPEYCSAIPCTWIYSSRYYSESIINMKAGRITYFDSMRQELNLPRTTNLPLSPHPFAVEYASVDAKLQKLGLEEKSFVFILPEATTCKELSNAFWKHVTDFLARKGKKCFFNITKQTSIPKTALTCPLSIPEAFIVAQRAECIISIKSGLSELFLQTGTVMHVIYTAFEINNQESMTAKQVYDAFKMEQFPACVTNTKVYSYIETDALLERLLENLI